MFTTEIQKKRCVAHIKTSMFKRRIGAAWASVRKYSSQLYDRRNARLSLKIRLFKAEVMEAMLYGCATWTMRSQDFSSLRTAHHKLLLRIIGFRRKDRIGYKPLSYREVLERTGSERIETTIRKRQLGFAGALVRQGDSRLYHLYMYMVAFLALRILYVVALVCFVFVPCSPPESLPGKDVLCRLLPRPLPSVCFLFFSFLFRPCSPPICFGETSSIL